MKKLLLIGAIALSGASMVNAQKIGAKAGVNMATLGGDVQDAKSKIGFHVGVYGEWAITDKFSIQPEVLYSAEGAKFKEEGITLNTNLNYINIPIMFKYRATDKLFIEAGPQVGFLIGAKYKSDNNDFQSFIESLGMNAKDDYKKINFSIGLGAGYDITEKFNVGVRYMAGLANIAEVEGSDYSEKSNVFSLSLGYRFK